MLYYKLHAFSPFNHPNLQPFHLPLPQILVIHLCSGQWWISVMIIGLSINVQVSVKIKPFWFIYWPAHCLKFKFAQCLFQCLQHQQWSTTALVIYIKAKIVQCLTLMCLDTSKWCVYGSGLLDVCLFDKWQFCQCNDLLWSPPRLVTYYHEILLSVGGKFTVVNMITILDTASCYHSCHAGMKYISLYWPFYLNGHPTISSIYCKYSVSSTRQI